MAPIKAFNRAYMCPVCGSDVFDTKLGLTSLFFSSATAHAKPEIVGVACCKSCAFSWTTREIAEDEAAKIYRDYRGDAYFKTRNKYEPWYSKSINEKMTSEAEMDIRREVFEKEMSNAMRIFGPRPAGTVVDFGGDIGQMLKNLTDRTKIVIDPSNKEISSWARRESKACNLAGQCDLALNCQVLEHVNNPAATLQETVDMLHENGWIYIEVPDEKFSLAATLPDMIQSRWLSLVARHQKLHIALDFFSTVFKIYFKAIPPFGFWSMREHINFFGEKSLKKLVARCGLELLTIGKTRSGWCVVARKNQSRPNQISKKDDAPGASQQSAIATINAS